VTTRKGTPRPRSAKRAVPTPRTAEASEPTPPLPPEPGLEWPKGQRWSLDTGEVLIISRDNILFRRTNAGMKFAAGEVYRADGTPQKSPTGGPLIVTGLLQKAKGMPGLESLEQSPSVAKVLFEGVVRVPESRLAYEITSSRVIDAATGMRTLSVETTDIFGNFRTAIVAVSVTRKTQSLEWLDPLGFVDIDSPAMMGKYIRALAASLPDAPSTLHGQGPLYLPDGTLALAVPSGVFNTLGEIVPGWRVDLSTLKPNHLQQMHDVNPNTDPETVTQGIAYLLEMLSMCRDYPEVPAAHLGQLFVSVLAPLNLDYFTVIWLHAKRGCGKTRFEALISAIQSPTLRDLSNIKPELNLGDVTGTTKGPKYRVPVFGLGTILGDDVFKAVHSALTKSQRTEMVDALIRSREAGAGAVGTLDKVRNIVSSKGSGELCASIRFTSEEAPPTRGGMESSTADRMIMQGGWTVPWNQVFDPEITTRVSDPTAIDAMHDAYSDLTLWVWQNQGETAVLFEEASDITSRWTMGSERVRSKYTPTVAGLLVLRERAVKHGFPASCVDAAIGALKTAAEAQTAPEKAVDIRHEVRQEVRLALREGHVSAVGRPIRAVSETLNALSNTPFVVTVDPDDEDKRLWTWPTGVQDEGDLGLRLDGARPRPKRDSAVEIYVRPPKPKPQGGRNKGTEHQWSLIVPISNGTFESLCRTLTRRREKVDGMEFDPSLVLAAFKDETDPMMPRKAKVRYYANTSDNGVGVEDQTCSPASCFVIPTEWLFQSDNETED
jgi:hypothetical protein